eukprot:Clim_evm21s237 gene=Clim_evmTU21s237
MDAFNGAASPTDPAASTPANGNGKGKEPSPHVHNGHNDTYAEDPSAYKVSITKTEKADGGHICYLVCSDSGKIQVWRRFREFDALNQKLTFERPFCIIPPVPPKHGITDILTTRIFDAKSPEFIAKRARLLESFLRRVLDHSELLELDCVKEFLGTNATNTDSNIRSAPEYTPKLPAKPPSSLTATRPSRIDPRMEQMHDYAEKMKALLKDVVKSFDNSTEIRTLLLLSLGDQSKGFQNWADIERERIGGDPVLPAALKHVGTFIAANAQRESDFIEAEAQQFVEKYEEQVMMMRSMLSLWKRYLVHQKEVEDAEKYVNDLKFELERVSTQLEGPVQDFAKKTKLEAKKEQVQKNIESSTKLLEELHEKHKKFMKAAISELHEFHQQRTKEVQALLRDYAELRLREARAKYDAFNALNRNIKLPEVSDVSS